MGCDKKQFTEALRKWDALHEQKCYSVAPRVGETAIIYSDYGMGETEEDIAKEIDVFEREAFTIAENIVAQNGLVRVIRGISPMNFYEEVIAPEEVANVVIIGHGAFSFVYCDNEKSIDWKEVADEATHLKQGYIEQRFCGNYSFNLSVPFGAFLASSPSNVFAPAGSYFSPETNPSHEELMRPVTHQSRLSFRYVKEHFPTIHSSRGPTQT